jgi:hypothetical protein
MKDLITFEYKKFNNIKNYSLVFIILGITFIIITVIAKINIKPIAVISIQTIKYNEIHLYLYLFWILTTIILPFFYLKYFQVEKTNDYFGKIRLFPQRFHQAYLAKLGFLTIQLFLLAIVMGTVISIKAYFVSNGDFFAVFDYFTIIKWVLLISLVTIFYYNILLFLFVVFKSPLILYAFHIINILLFPFQSFYWIPLNWSKLVISYIGSIYYKDSFFKIHPPSQFGLIILVQLVLMLITFIIIKREQNN